LAESFAGRGRESSAATLLKRDGRERPERVKATD
jgi:hypothetical protein